MNSNQTTVFALFEEAGAFELTISHDGELTETRKLGPVDGGPTDALQAHPGLLHVGSGITTITADDAYTAEILPILTFGEECSEEEWVEWIEEDWPLNERLDHIALPDGYRLGHWRIRFGDGLIRVFTNGTRSIALSFPDGEDYLFENMPTPWEPMFEWSFSNESGGPCIWDGACTAGLVAPDALMEFERGDQNPGIRLSIFDPDSLAEVLMSEAEFWALPLLVGRSGLPGLTADERMAVWQASPDNSQEFSLSCSDELAEDVVEGLIASDSSLADANAALLNPDSEMGRTVYAWLRGFAGSVPVGERVDWFKIFDALRGDLGDPTPLTEAEIAEREAAARRRVEEARRRAVEAQRQAHDRLRAEVAKAMADETDAVEQIRTRLVELAGLKETVAAARKLLGLSREEAVLHRHVTERLQQRPGDEDWELETWDAFWTVQRSYSQPSEKKLRSALAKAEQAQATREERRARKQGKAEADGWPSAWPWQLLDVWRAHGGTVNSARAWADAGYTAEEVLLGNPQQPEAMEGLAKRLRKRKPTPKASTIIRRDT